VPIHLFALFLLPENVSTRNKMMVDVADELRKICDSLPKNDLEYRQYKHHLESTREAYEQNKDNPTLYPIVANNYARFLLDVGQVQKAHDIFKSLLGKQVYAPSNYYFACEHLGIPLSERELIAQYFPNILNLPQKHYHHDRIHIGYLTSDASLGGNARLLFEVIKNHDKDKFKTVFFYNNTIYDDLTFQIGQRFEKSFTIRDAKAKEIFDLIAAEEIDILVDPMGHCAGGPNLPIFAQHPAPMQITGFGYPGTTALPFFDYRIGSDICKGFTEPLLKNKYGYSPLSFISGVPCKTTETHVIGCLSNLSKIMPEDIKLHAVAMNALPGYELHYIRMDGQFMDDKRDEILNAHHAFGNERVRVINSSDTYQSIILSCDALLDTATWNNHILAMDALSYGVSTIRIKMPEPSLTCASLLSKDVVAQLGESILDRLGAEGWEHYYKIAQSWDNAPWVREYERLLQEAYHAVK
jgi:hypothetical protein